MNAPAQRVKITKVYPWLIPFAIYLIALAVRLIGLKFSFPLLTHHDEQYVIDPLIEMSRNHTLDSGRYAKGGQFTYTVLFGYLNLISKLFFHKNFGWAYSEDPLFFYFHARMVIAFFGALAPVLAWKIGKLIKGIDFSLAAAFLTCFYPPFIVHSHYITPDMLNAVFALAIILLCLLYLQNLKPVWMVLACVAVALNTIEKYPGILSFGIVLVTLGISVFSQKNKSAKEKLGRFLLGTLIAMAIVVLAMFLFAPHFFFKLDLIREALKIEARATHLGADNLNWLGNMLFYLKVFVKSAGWIVALFVVVGVVFSVISRQPEVLLLYFGAGYWVAMSKLGLHWERWSLPMMITPLLLSAFGVSKLWGVINRQKFARAAAIVFFVVVGFVYALNGLSSSVLLTWKDTRASALHFAEEKGITEEKTMGEGYTPFLPRSAITIFGFDFNNPGQVDYVILSSNMYGRFEAEPDRYTAENAYYADLRSKATLVAEFVPERKPTTPIEKLAVVGDYLHNLFTGTKTIHTTGPTIQIYRLP